MPKVSSKPAVARPGASRAFVPGTPRGKRKAPLGKLLGTEQIDPSLLRWTRPFPSRTWGPILPMQVGAYYGPVTVYGPDETTVIRVISQAALDKRQRVITGASVGPGAPADWRLPRSGPKDGKRSLKRKYEFKGSGGTPLGSPS